jgi:hypothetical protein
MEVEDWNESSQKWDKKDIVFENVEDIFDVMRHGLSYAYIAKYAQNVTGFISTGNQVYSEYRTLENLWVDAKTNNITYHYSDRPFIFLNSSSYELANIVNGKNTTITNNYSYTFVIGNNNNVAGTGKSNQILGDNNYVLNSSYNIIVADKLTLNGNATAYNFVAGHDSTIASLHNSVLITKSSTVTTDLNDSNVITNNSEITKVYNSNVNSNTSKFTNIHNSNIIAANSQDNISLTYTFAIFNGTTKFGENLESISTSLLITGNNNATIGGTTLNNSIIIGDSITTNNIKNSISVGKNVSVVNGDGSVVVGNNVTVANANGILVVGNNLNSSSENESAIGKYNVSNPAYLFSIGNGENGSRHNALTVLKNGTLTIEKLSVDFQENVIYCTHNEAVSNMLKGKLQTGKMYCIYDYYSNVAENIKNITVSGKIYPIVLLAISSSEFSTNAWMIIGNQPGRGAKLYTSDNSYYFVNVGLYRKNDGGVYWQWVKRSTSGTFDPNTYLLTNKPAYPFIDEVNTFTYSDDIVLTKFEYYDGSDMGVYTATWPDLGLKHVEIKYDILVGEHKYSNEHILPLQNQRGFIYWMKDEYGNEADFDLYSVKFNGNDPIQNNASHNKLFNSYKTILNGANYNTIDACYDIQLSGVHGNEIKKSNSINVGCSNSSIKHSTSVEILQTTNKFNIQSCKNIKITGTNYTKDNVIQMNDIEDNANIVIPNIDGPVIFRSTTTREILL